MGPPLGATPSAHVLKVVSHLTKDSAARSRGKSAPGTGTGIGTPPCLSNSAILLSTVCKYLIILSTTPCCCVSIFSSLAS